MVYLGLEMLQDDGRNERKLEDCESFCGVQMRTVVIYFPNLPDLVRETAPEIGVNRTSPVWDFACCANCDLVKN